MRTVANEHDQRSASSRLIQAASSGSLGIRNFRLFVVGQVFSNVGSWVQRVAQDWLVLSLTGSATAVGVTTALQFAPALLFAPFGGLLADRHPKRLILLATQVGMAAMAAALAWLTLTDHVSIWQVYLIAFGLGSVTAIDNTTRQSFVTEMVGTEHLRSAITINSSAFQLGALVGPAVSGMLISAVGPGCSFVINAVSYMPPFLALLRMHDYELNPAPQVPPEVGQLRDSWSYSVHCPQVRWPMVLVGVFGMFTSNLPVSLAAYAKHVFHSGPGGYGLLSSVVAVGSLAGAFIAARQPRARLTRLVAFGAILATAYLFVALAPNQASFCAMLLIVGATTLLLLSSANSTVQLAADETIRGRVMGAYLAVITIGATIGGPLLGSTDQHFGPRVGMLLAGGVSGIAAVLVALRLSRGERRSFTALRCERFSSERPRPWDFVLARRRPSPASAPLDMRRGTVRNSHTVCAERTQFEDLRFLHEAIYVTAPIATLPAAPNPGDVASRLKTVHVYAVTPFLADDLMRVDVDGLTANLEFLLRNGVRVVAVGGGTGEVEALSDEELLQVAKIAADTLGDQALTIASLPGNISRAAYLAPQYERLGIQLAVAIPPLVRWHVPSDLEGVAAHYEIIADQSAIGLMPYNVQGWPTSFISRLAEIDRVVAIKDPCIQPLEFFRAIKSLGERLVWIGNKRHDPGVLHLRYQMGMDGFTSGQGNYLPGPELQMHAAALRHDWTGIVALQEQMAPLERLRSSYDDVASVKAAMDISGLTGGRVRPPRRDLSQAARDELESALADVAATPSIC